MPGGEFTPNGSVHWSIDVEELDAQQHPQGKDSPWNGAARANSGATVTPRGAQGRLYLHGVDPINVADHPTLRVTLRAGSETVLRDALLAASDAIVAEPDTQLYRAVVEIPAENAGDAADNPPRNPRAQVRVDWGR